MRRFHIQTEWKKIRRKTPLPFRLSWQGAPWWFIGLRQQWSLVLASEFRCPSTSPDPTAADTHRPTKARPSLIAGLGRGWPDRVCGHVGPVIDPYVRRRSTSGRRKSREITRDDDRRKYIYTRRVTKEDTSVPNALHICNSNHRRCRCGTERSLQASRVIFRLGTQQRPVIVE